MTAAADPAADRLRLLAGGLGLTLAIALAYLPAMHGGPVWDDDYMLTGNPVMTQAGGLWRILFDPSAMQVYYPLTSATLWLESRLFGLTDLTGYHVVNVLLHAANAVVLWRLLRRLDVPGAFAAAAAWGLHPVGVESVAWVTEHKNTLSGLLYLTSLWALLRSLGVIGPERRPRAGRAWYAVALATFALALAAKTTAVTLPAAALLVAWWKAGRVRRRDVWAVVPFVAVAAVAGAVTQHVETHVTGTWDPAWSLTPPQMVLVAGRALWFYAAKLAWPAGLSFAYPRWRVDPAAAGQWAYPAAAAGVIAGLWAARGRVGRGPVTGVLFFAGTLVPALGFFHVLYQRYSFVADHFQYLAGVGLIAVAAAAVARTRLPPPAKVAIAAAVLVTLAGLTARSARRFASDAAVWRAALDVDPGSTLANLNYGSALVGAGDYDAAMVPLRRAAADPTSAGRVWYNLGLIADGRRDYRGAVACFARSAAVEPFDPRSHFEYGETLLVTGRFPAAAAELRRAVALRPGWAGAHDTLGVCLLHLGRPADAAAEFAAAGRLDPSLPLLAKHRAEAAAAGG